MMTLIRGSSNAKAKSVLGWEPAWKSRREGHGERPGLEETGPFGAVPS